MAEPLAEAPPPGAGEMAALAAGIRAAEPARLDDGTLDVAIPAGVPARDLFLCFVWPLIGWVRKADRRSRLRRAALVAARTGSAPT